MAADRLAANVGGGGSSSRRLGWLWGLCSCFFVGSTTSQVTLILSMTLFGFCKGFMIRHFASLYDSIEPRARARRLGS